MLGSSCLERVNAALGRFLAEISLKGLSAVRLVKKPLGAVLASVNEPLRNSTRQAADGGPHQGGERADDGRIHRCSPPSRSIRL